MTSTVLARLFGQRAINYFPRLKLCTFIAELLGTGSGNMAWDIGPPNALDRRFDDLSNIECLSDIVTTTSVQTFPVD